MRSFKQENYVRTVMRHIRFIPDRHEIQTELTDHMDDLYAELHEQGMDEEAVEKEIIERMGDPDRLGIELNKAHSPIWGYLWQLSIILLFVVLLALIAQQVMPLIHSFDGRGEFEASSEILYEMELDQVMEIDDVIVEFERLYFEENSNVTLRYRYYYKSILDRLRYRNPVFFSFSLNTDQGELLFRDTGSRSEPFYRVERFLTAEALDPKATVLEIHYDVYDRHLQVDIPLEWRDRDE